MRPTPFRRLLFPRTTPGLVFHQRHAHLTDHHYPFIESLLVGYPTLVLQLTVRLDLNSSELWDQVRI